MPGNRPKAAAPRFFIYTSGFWVVGRSSQATDESAELNPIALAEWRVEHDELAVAANGPHMRTAVIQNGQLQVQAGAGIVYDSDPEKEWDETMNKGRALFRAVAQAASGL